MGVSDVILLCVFLVILKVWKHIAVRILPLVYFKIGLYSVFNYGVFLEHSVEQFSGFKLCFP
jgi:hypothetical protein